MTYEQFTRALAITESGDNTRAWGDKGLAVGRHQMHPSFVWQWKPENVAVEESWDSMFETCLRAFYNHFSKRTSPITMVMIFHLGERAVLHLGEWDHPYQKRFEEALAKIENEKETTPA